MISDINECEGKTHNCSSNAVCNNTKGDGNNCTGNFFRKFVFLQIIESIALFLFFYDKMFFTAIFCQIVDHITLKFKAESS